MSYALGLVAVCAGFFITAAGVPISSFALFAFLIRLSRARRFGWQFAAVISGLATALGHVCSLVAFRAFGPRLKASLERFFPMRENRLDAVEERLYRRWPVMFFLRWLGGGYSQVFWVAGMTGGPLEKLVIPFVINDFLWAAFWCFALTAFSDRAPLLERWLTIAGIAAMLATPLTVYLTIRRTAAPAHEQSSLSTNAKDQY